MQLRPPSTAADAGTLLLVGLRAGDGLDSPVMRPADCLIVVEPDGTRPGPALRAATAVGGVMLHEAALGVIGSQAVLHRMNFPMLDSLRPPGPALFMLYPGLQEIARRPVPVITPAAVLGPAASVLRPLHVVIDCPGSEQDILDALRADGLLGVVDRIEMRCGVEAFHDGAASRDALESQLIAAGFDVSAGTAGLQTEDDPDWPVLIALPRQDAGTAEGEETSMPPADCAAQAQEIAVNNALTAERDAMASAAAEEAAALSAERARRDGLLEEAERRATGLQDRLAALRAERDAMAAAAAAEVAALSAERARRDGLLAEGARQLSSAQAAHDALGREMAEKLELARSDLALAVRAQTMAQNDLRDLQGRFAALHQLCRRQDSLLRQLTPRLQEAADHLREHAAAFSAGSVAAPDPDMDAPADAAAAHGPRRRKDAIPAKSARLDGV